MPYLAQIAAVLIGTTAIVSPALAGKSDDTLNVAFNAEIATLDYFKETARPGLIMGRQIYDTLLDKNLDTGEFVPNLAASYRVVDDRTLEFKIKPNIKFHDGSILSVDDVVYTYNLVAGGQYVRYTAQTAWIDRAERVDGETVRIVMKDPTPLALELIAGAIPIYSKAYHSKVGPQGMATAPIGTGPYRFKSMTQGIRYAFERFDDYHASGLKPKPAIANLVTKILPEQNTQYAEVLNGQLDWIWRVPQTEAARLSRPGKLTMTNIETVRTTFIQLNPAYQAGKSPLADVRVRKALNMAIDRDKIIKGLVKGASKPTFAPCHPIQFGCGGVGEPYRYDPEGARKLLAEAGFPNGFAIEMLMTNDPLDHVEAVVAELGKVGVRITLNQQQPASGTTIWRSGNAAMRFYDWGSNGVADAGMAVPAFFAGNDDDRVKSKELIADITAAEREMDRSKRKRLYESIVNQISQQAYVVPLWSNSFTTIQNAQLALKPGYDEFVPFYAARWN